METRHAGPSARVTKNASLQGGTAQPVHHIRFHGRGGEGVKVAGRIVSRAGFLAGLAVQDSPLYGAERRGAPIVAFTRVSSGPILERGYVERPDAVVVMDDSLLCHPEAAVLDGVEATSLVLVNSARRAEDLKAEFVIRGRVVTLDLSSIALELLGHHLLSAPSAGFAVKTMRLAPWDLLAEAVRIELGDIALPADLVACNLRATRRAFDAAPPLGLSEHPLRHVALPFAVPFVLPRLPARIAAPSIVAAATSALRSTADWRVWRPLIDLGRCSRCFLCFALCPEGAIALDADNYPVIDYDHCKGCLVCVSECPPRAIHQVRETEVCAPV